MDKTKSFLAEEVFVEKKIITYRYLSRAVHIPVNAAKRALFDFHKSQNAKTPGSVHATYLLYGTKSQDALPGAADGDVGMDDVDGDGDDDDAGLLLDEQVTTFSMTLVAEAQLPDALAQYAALDAIHVYSLSAEPVKDLQALADGTRQLRELRGAPTDTDPKAFGVIPNPHVRRRQRKTPLPAAKTARAAAAATTNPDSIWNKKGKEEKKEGKEKEEEKKEEKKADTNVTKPDAKEKPKEAPKRTSGGGIMQAFAKGAAAAAAKPKKPTPPAKPAPKQDTAMALSDESDSDDAGLVIPKAQVVTGGKTRKQREEELRKMMDEEEEEEDEDEDEGEEDEREEEERQDTPMEDAVDDEPALAPAPEAKAAAKADEPAEVVSSSTGDGRRRGKRRVMKKKMVQDEDGYLVTVQEAAWESFSEDDAPAPAPKEKPAAGTAAKPKKPAAKTGQGSIMSFFAKK